VSAFFHGPRLPDCEIEDAAALAWEDELIANQSGREQPDRFERRVVEIDRAERAAGLRLTLSDPASLNGLADVKHAASAVDVAPSKRSPFLWAEAGAARVRLPRAVPIALSARRPPPITAP
jgi:hypothetical protein